MKVDSVLMPQKANYRRHWPVPSASGQRLIALGLILAVLIVYGRLAFFDSVFFDDHVYVIEKTQVLSGLSASSLHWAFTTTDAGFWHPLTWISLMIDHDLWGMNPGGYHLTNVFLHLAATLLLFAALHRLTGAIGKSGLVAAMFALHPLHVESVAWIAERKDVLSGVFWMLSLYLYARYAEKPILHRYALVLLSFFLGLMAKSMVVTLPIICLLLDIWPLKRLSMQTWRHVVAEKIPFLILGTAAGAVTILAEQQVGALKTFAEFSLSGRLTNAVVAYGFYLYKTVYPFSLAVHYPHPGSWPLSIVSLSLLIVGTVTFFAVKLFKTQTYFLIGWLWYIITLLPVIGLIQIGNHAYADRYTYIPLIGVFMAVVWGAEAWGNGKSGRQLSLAILAVVVTVFFALVSSQQIRHWQNAETLFRQAVAVTGRNYLAHNNLGAALSRQGRYGEAVGQFILALNIRPDYPESLFNMGVALAGQGRYDDAILLYERVLALNPNFAEGHNNAAIVYARRHEFDRARIHFREALRLRPEYPEAINNLKIMEEQAKKGKTGE